MIKFGSKQMAAALGLVLLALAAVTTAQKPGAAVRKPAAPASVTLNGITVKVVDATALKKLIIPNGKPLLVNFWATWCDPCREEFPDLVKINAEYKGRIDFITISLDEPEDLAVAVPKFLAEMKADMPAYLLKAADESAVITSISKDWAGGMPFTILFNAKGEAAHSRQGKINPQTVRAEINKLLADTTAAAR